MLPFYLRPLTEAQIRAQTNKRVEDIMGPQRADLERQSASRVATIQAAAKAASDLLASHAGITQEGYHTATQDLNTIGGGYSDEMKARMQAVQSAAQQFVQSQGGTVQGGTDVNALSDTVRHGGIGIPGSSLASQGAAATALDSQMAGIPALQGAQDIRQNMQESEQALMDLAAKRPELRSQILDELQKREMDKLQGRIQTQAQDLYAAQFGETVRSHLTQEGLSRERNKLSKMRYNEQVRTHDMAIAKAQAEGRQPNASLSRAYGYIVDAKGNPILDKNGKHIQVAQSTSSKSKAGKAQAQYGKAVGEAEAMFQDSRPGPPAAPGLPETPAKREWQWGNALRYLQNRYGITKARARQALIAAGFKPPGAKGPKNPPYGGTPGY